MHLSFDIKIIEIYWKCRQLALAYSVELCFWMYTELRNASYK